MQLQFSRAVSQQSAATGQRILAAAAALFGELGYNGVSLRDIAIAAGVSEVTIYRYYPQKRNLYVAALTAELQGITLRGDRLTEIAQAGSARVALTRTINMIAAAVTREPEFVRLVLRSSLECSEELQLLLRTQLGELVEVISRYLDPWVVRGDIRCPNSKGLVITLIGAIIFHHSLHRAFSRNATDPDRAFESLIELCLADGFVEGAASTTRMSCSESVNCAVA
jgi:AcrR family transcriptional regulator